MTAFFLHQLKFAAAFTIVGVADVSNPQDVLSIFERSCENCHDSTKRKKPKGGFGHVLDLDRLASEGEYVIPGKPEESALFIVLIDQDPDIRMSRFFATAGLESPLRQVHGWDGFCSNWVSDGTTGRCGRLRVLSSVLAQ
jgi:hypothetical protein